MVNAIDRAPDALTRAGQEFNYAVWTAGTRITLHSVPWSADYRDVVDFSTQSELDYWLSHNENTFIEIKRVTYARPGDSVRLDIPVNTLMRYNYMRVENPVMPVNGDRSQVYYYFIGDVRMVAPNTTEVAVMLDVWNTFRWNVTFGNCYVERGHIGIAEAKGMEDNGRDLLCQPEGLDLGNEYVTVETWAHHVANTSDVDYLIFSNIELGTDYGTKDNPSLSTAIGSQAENLPSGMSIYHFKDVTSLLDYLGKVSNAPWVSQGIVSIIAVPGDMGVSTQSVAYVCPDDSGNPVNGNIDVLVAVTPSRPVTLTPNLSSDMVRSVLGTGRYANLLKFLTYPYTFLEATTFTGAPLVIKPECVASPDLRFIEMTHLVQPSPRITYGLMDYNTDSRSAGIVVGDGGVGAANTANSFEASSVFDMQTGIFDFPQFSTVNNSYINYMASNRNSIAYQHSSADWSQQKALQGNQLGYNQATAGMNLNAQLNHNNNQSAMLGTAANVATNVAGAIATDGLTLGTAIGSVGQAAQTGIGVWNNNRNFQATNANAAYMRDSNKDYADWAARGDYANTIAGIQAKCQDAKLMQPSTVGQVGGDAFLLAVNRWSLVVKVKTLQLGAMASIGEYWLRYGYAINRFYNFSLHGFSVMEKFTYWKVSETYIVNAPIPETFKNALRGILEKGVTVWRSPEFIGRIDIADNQPIIAEYLKIGQ